MILSSSLRLGCNDWVVRSGADGPLIF